MKKTALCLVSAVCMLILGSCHQEGKSIITPNSSGRPY